MKLEECKTPKQYRKYAINNKSITHEERQICLYRQKTEKDHYRFARDVRNLTENQIQICLDGQKTAKDYRKFAEYVPNLTEDQMWRCIYKQETAWGYYWFYEEVPNLTYEQKQYCKESKQSCIESSEFSEGAFVILTGFVMLMILLYVIASGFGLFIDCENGKRHQRIDHAPLKVETFDNIHH